MKARVAGQERGAQSVRLPPARPSRRRLAPPRRYPSLAAKPVRREACTLSCLSKSAMRLCSSSISGVTERWVSTPFMPGVPARGALPEWAACTIPVPDCG